jgi:hypothetical protein
VVYEDLGDGYVHLTEYDEVITKAQFDGMDREPFEWRWELKNIGRTHIHPDQEPNVKPIPGIPKKSAHGQITQLL